MKKIDEGYDNLLKSKYELYSVQLFELRDLAKSWYKDINFKEFDNRHIRSGNENEFIEMKRTGITCNYFFAYRENDKYYLLDGFNRLFTDYGQIKIDCTVYLKVLVDTLEDSQLMYIMFTLNMWKLYKSSYSGNGFHINDFLDRGFRLFVHSKFGIDFYTWKEWDDRTRNKKDIDVLEYYFIKERDFCGYFKFNIDEVAILFSRKNIVNDIREIIKCNNYLTPPFNNYEDFLSGFIMYMTENRVNGDDDEYKFQTYLDKLYADKKFFKKLQGMSGNESTRKNIYYFFRGPKEKPEPTNYKLKIEMF